MDIIHQELRYVLTDIPPVLEKIANYSFGSCSFKFKARSQVTVINCSALVNCCVAMFQLMDFRTQQFKKTENKSF